ncbi:polysaccharide lyase family 7 protein [Lasiosphaeria ovina]|uniref:Polysaccharide lyase family 7 protein n=1 Tax=Lasiosphaeria ovina TaxID=92902 RepID=A0AAE0NAI6_9PEZI|nr:polysaccharide lyase family 7 protein [Lasiosphaeria ovina]
MGPAKLLFSCFRPHFILVLASSLSLAAALNPACAPGGNFDLSKFTLQLPSGSPGKPDTVTGAKLSGCSGFQNKDFFFTGPDGSLQMKVPGDTSTGCVTTPNSKHCRTELREQDPVSWDPNGATNVLSANLTVVSAGGSTCIGQIHIDDTVSHKPVAELFINDGGKLTVGMEQTRAGGNEKSFDIGSVALGQPFSYEIHYEKNVFSVVLNGAKPVVVTTFSLNAPKSYFKVGNYLQASKPSVVNFFSIDIQHA